MTEVVYFDVHLRQFVGHDIHVAFVRRYCSIHEIQLVGDEHCKQLYGHGKQPKPYTRTR